MNNAGSIFKIFLGVLLLGCAVSAKSQKADGQLKKSVFAVDKTEHDYGTIPEDGGLANHVFTVTNAGNQPLVINNVASSCGCTTPDWTREPIAAGKTGEIKVAYNPKGRIGAFNRAVTVYGENTEPVQLTIKGNVVQKAESEAPKVPVFKPLETSFNFGTIGESDGYAEHVFKFKNEGTSPLLITQVQASCGCTTPEWTTTPVEPGQEGVIILTFNPRGRLGSFNKSATVHTNEDGGYKRHKLIITGNVVNRPRDLNAYCKDTVGGVGIEDIVLEYNTFDPVGANKKTVYIKNSNPEAVYFTLDNVPDFMTVTYPDSLKAEWPGEIAFAFDGTKTTGRKGRFNDLITLTVKDNTGNALGSETISLKANYIDDFNGLSPLQKVNSPTLEVQNVQLDLGEVKDGFLGLFGGSASKSFVLVNVGKSDLTVHSVSSDDPRVHTPNLNGKVIKVGESLAVSVNVKAKEIGENNIDTDIYVVCNDPRGPVRRIKVTAQKAN
ncbi:MAG: DUF1573 domain-containing protein [Tannerella sp.]|jgi:hypothetical protein|nr:DUF1573 domain-containing protein [Tannerella sp.]